MKDTYEPTMHPLTLILAGLITSASIAGVASISAASRTVDDDFARAAASGALMEVKLGQLAEEKGATESVREFGHRMVADHGKAYDELRQAVQQRGLFLSTDISKDDQPVYDRLTKLQGTDFDVQYAKEMVKDHQIDLAAFEKEAESGIDEALREFANRTTPIIREHLSLAETLEQTSYLNQRPKRNVLAAGRVI